MFEGFGEDLIPFFLDLRFHNEKAFMDANRARYYRSVREPFYQLIEAMAPAMLAIDPDMETRPVKCLSRINRDTRFSQDKSPYRDHLWLAFRPAAKEKNGLPFYWLEIGPDQTNCGLGIWGENRPAMDHMRRKMLAQPDVFAAVLPILKKRGFSLAGTEWKKMNCPPEIPETLRPWYLKREIFAEKLLPQELIYHKSLPEQVTADYAALKPLYLILRGCVEEAVNDL